METDAFEKQEAVFRQAVKFFREAAAGKQGVAHLGRPLEMGWHRLNLPRIPDTIS
jgi:hypothetical protein